MRSFQGARAAMSTRMGASPAHARLIALGGAGVLLAAVLAVGILLPLALWEHDEVVHSGVPLAEVYGLGRDGALRLFVAILGAYAAFAIAAVFARGLAGRTACRLVLAGTVLLALILVPTNPAGSHDIYHNIADARTFWIYNANPALTPPAAFPDDPFLPHVAAWRDFPSAYGPIWYAISGIGLPITGSGLWSNVIAQKLLCAAFLVATTALVMATAGRIRPGTAPLAGVLVGWNPLLLFETAGSAHNDIVMVTFAIAAIYALVRGWWLAVFPLLALAVSVKYVLVLLGPLFLLWMLRQSDAPRRHVMLSLLVAALATLAFYAPFLIEGAVQESLTRQADWVLASPGGALTALLMADEEVGFGQAEAVMKAVMVGWFIVGYLVVMWRLWRETRVDALIVGCFWVTFLFLATVVWWFWPWYLLWLIPIAALVPRKAEALLAALFSFTGMLMYNVYFWRVNDLGWRDMQLQTAATVFLLPLLLALVLLMRAPGRARRSQPAPAPAPPLAGAGELAE